MGSEWHRGVVDGIFRVPAVIGSKTRQHSAAMLGLNPIKGLKLATETLLKTGTGTGLSGKLDLLTELELVVDWIC